MPAKARKARRIAAIAKQLHQLAELQAVEALRAKQANEAAISLVLSAIDAEETTSSVFPDLYARQLGNLVGKDVTLGLQTEFALKALAAAHVRVETLDQRLVDATRAAARATFEKELANAMPRPADDVNSSQP